MSSIEEVWESVGRGDEVSLDGVDGAFLVINEKKTRYGTKIALDVIDEDDVDHRIQKIDLGETFLRISEGHDTPVVTNVDSVDLIRAIEIVGRDQSRFVDHINSKYGHA